MWLNFSCQSSLAGSRAPCDGAPLLSTFVAIEGTFLATLPSELPEERSSAPSSVAKGEGSNEHACLVCQFNRMRGIELSYEYISGSEVACGSDKGIERRLLVRLIDTFIIGDDIASADREVERRHVASTETSRIWSLRRP
jgi:hypothetical protein